MEQTPSEKGTKAAAGALSALPRGAAGPAARPLSRPLPVAAAGISQRGLGGAASRGLREPYPPPTSHLGERGACVSRPSSHPADARAEEAAGLVRSLWSSGKPWLITQAGKNSGLVPPTTSLRRPRFCAEEVNLGEDSPRVETPGYIHHPGCPAYLYPSVWAFHRTVSHKKHSSAFCL